MVFQDGLRVAPGTHRTVALEDLGRGGSNARARTAVVTATPAPVRTMQEVYRRALCTGLLRVVRGR